MDALLAPSRATERIRVVTVRSTPPASAAAAPWVIWPDSIRTPQASTLCWAETSSRSSVSRNVEFVFECARCWWKSWSRRALFYSNVSQFAKQQTERRILSGQSSLDGHDRSPPESAQRRSFVAAGLSIFRPPRIRLPGPGSQHSSILCTVNSTGVPSSWRPPAGAPTSATVRTVRRSRAPYLRRIVGVTSDRSR